MRELIQNGKFNSCKSDFRTRIYDVLRGKGDWIKTHNGRAIINDTLLDYEQGVSEAELQEKYDLAIEKGDYSRLVVFAGTGAGLVTKSQSVNEILDELEYDFRQQVEMVTETLKFVREVMNDQWRNSIAF